MDLVPALAAEDEPTKIRLSPDPTISVCDLMAAITEFLKDFHVKDIKNMLKSVVKAFSTCMCIASRIE